MTARPSRHVRVRYAGRLWTLLAAHETSLCIERRDHVRWVPRASIDATRTGTGLRQRQDETASQFLARCLATNSLLSTRAARTRGQED